MIYIDLGKHLEYSTIERIKKPLLNAKGFNVLLVCLEKSQEIPPHPEPYDVFFLVIEGRGKIIAGKEKYDVRPNHAVFIPENEVRGIKPKTRMSLLGIRGMSIERMNIELNECGKK